MGVKWGEISRNFFSGGQTWVNGGLIGRFRKYGQTGLLKEKPDNDDWKELEISFNECAPALCVMINQSNLSQLDKQVVILTYLGFTAKEMSVILDKSAQRITNLKANSNEKLFNQSDARTLLKNLKTVQ